MYSQEGFLLKEKALHLLVPESINIISIYAFFFNGLLSLSLDFVNWYHQNQEEMKGKKKAAPRSDYFCLEPQ